MPYVTAIATISVDGKITPPEREGTDFSSAETGANFMFLLKKTDACISGRKTYDVVGEMMRAMSSGTDSAPLNIIMTRNPDEFRSIDNPSNFEFTDMDPRALISSLSERGMERILIAGGGEVYSSFAAAGVVDEWFIVIEPILLGGGKPIFSFPAEQKLRMIESKMLNDGTIAIRYTPVT
jgi:dihydrofolate reductase